MACVQYRKELSFPPFRWFFALRRPFPYRVFSPHDFHSHGSEWLCPLGDLLRADRLTPFLKSPT